ncbi:hypothetical protein K470DRAFT_136047 [Piedraia hortae CBS 480.64]|uniref:Uncharacterized protein n=1 Tax=Piedraia hortae CBS 480.64 TaxID=1314780 RepID=A0A6A7BSV4_9PEZI|nr:hypothetical protein K470DRAFT_136047 [Piedraia hortae CBS 480.64]
MSQVRLYSALQASKLHLRSSLERFRTIRVRFNAHEISIHPQFFSSKARFIQAYEGVEAVLLDIDKLFSERILEASTTRPPVEYYELGSELEFIYFFYDYPSLEAKERIAAIMSRNKPRMISEWQNVMDEDLTTMETLLIDARVDEELMSDFTRRLTFDTGVDNDVAMTY